MKKHLFLLASLCLVLVSCDQPHRGSSSSGTGTTGSSTDTRTGDPTVRSGRGGSTDARTPTDARDPRLDGR